MRTSIKYTASFLLLFGLLLPGSGLAATTELQKIYETRGDLQVAFDAKTLKGLPASPAGFLINLEDWARQYGWKEYPELYAYRPATLPVTRVRESAPPSVTSDYYIVIDDASGEILSAQGADVEWPIASITKLATAKMASEHGLDFYAVGTLENVDDVGGARLAVLGGTKFLVGDLLRATLIGSANNAANAIARITGKEKSQFIHEMNMYAERLGLRATVFTDPTGIESTNRSTAREVAHFAKHVFEDSNIRRLTGTSRMTIQAISKNEYIRNISNTNQLLYDPDYDDVYVTAGKTGFLYESGWNLVVRMHPMGESEGRSVLLVLFSADSRKDSFNDAHKLAKWAWSEFNWSSR